jgi:hypothetical protein
MAGKKPMQTEGVTEAQLKFREKRKWQLALRRYVIEQKANENYALYFGLDIKSFREWIEIQFTEDLNWESFAVKWQFDHIVPVAYFDFSIEEDLKLCWNFVNIRVEKIELNKARGNRVDVIAVKAYFETLYRNTNYFLCTRMLAKIDEIEVSNIVSEPKIEAFINARKADFEIMYTLTAAEFAQMNRGVPFNDVLLEREILRKFG